MVDRIFAVEPGTVLRLPLIAVEKETAPGIAVT